MTSEQKAIKLLSELFAAAISIKAGRNVKRSVQSCRKRWDQFIMIAGNINVLWSKRHRVRRPAIHRPILLPVVSCINYGMLLLCHVIMISTVDLAILSFSFIQCARFGGVRLLVFWFGSCKDNKKYSVILSILCTRPAVLNRFSLSYP